MKRYTHLILYAKNYNITTPQRYFRNMDGKRYELSNPLSNVLAVVSDLKRGMGLNGSSNTAYYYRAVVILVNDIDTSCQEKSYGFRIYDPRKARFLSVNLLTKDLTV